MINEARFKQFKEFVETKLNAESSDDARRAYVSVLDEVNKILSPVIFVIKMDNDFFVKINNHDYRTYDAMDSTIFEKQEDAEHWIKELHRQGVSTKFELITIPKENVKAGDILYGYCNGFFGGVWEDKKVIEVTNGNITVEFGEGETYTEYLSSWGNILAVQLAVWKREI